MKLADYRKLSPAINAELTAVLARHGLKVTKLNAGVEESMGTVSLSIKCADANHKDADGNATTTEAEYYKRFCGLVSMRPEWLGAKLRMGKHEFKITGMKNTRSSKCIMLMRDDARVFVASAEDVSLRMPRDGDARPAERAAYGRPANA